MLTNFKTYLETTINEITKDWNPNQPKGFLINSPELEAKVKKTNDILWHEFTNKINEDNPNFYERREQLAAAVTSIAHFNRKWLN